MALSSIVSRSNWNLGMLVFVERGKPEYPEKKPPGARARTNNKLNPNMTPSPGIEPGSHWWEASALTTAPSLLPKDLELSGVKSILYKPSTQTAFPVVVLS